MGTFIEPDYLVKFEDEDGDTLLVEQHLGDEDSVYISTPSLGVYMNSDDLDEFIEKLAAIALTLD